MQKNSERLMMRGTLLIPQVSMGLIPFCKPVSLARYGQVGHKQNLTTM